IVPSHSLPLATLLSDLRAKHLSEHPLSHRRDDQRAGAIDAPRPPIADAVGADRGTHQSSEMRSSLAPVEARAAENAARRPGAPCQYRIGIDADVAQKRDPGVREYAGITGQFDMAAPGQSVG